jgi:hypothetical protein
MLDYFLHIETKLFAYLGFRVLITYELQHIGKRTSYNQLSLVYHSSSPKRPPPKPTSASSSLAAGLASSFLASVLAGAACPAPPAGAAPELPPLTELIHNIQYSFLPKERVESFLDPEAMTWKIKIYINDAVVYFVESLALKSIYNSGEFFFVDFTSDFLKDLSDISIS